MQKMTLDETLKILELSKGEIFNKFKLKFYNTPFIIDISRVNNNSNSNSDDITIFKLFNRYDNHFFFELTPKNIDILILILKNKIAPKSLDLDIEALTILANNNFHKTLFHVSINMRKTELEPLFIKKLLMLRYLLNNIFSTYKIEIYTYNLYIFDEKRRFLKIENKKSFSDLQLLFAEQSRLENEINKLNENIKQVKINSKLMNE